MTSGDSDIEAVEARPGPFRRGPGGGQQHFRDPAAKKSRFGDIYWQFVLSFAKSVVFQYERVILHLAAS